jgi:hypothetical protein
MTINYPLGKAQLGILDALHTFESYFKGCEWVYLYHSDTVETLEGLVRRDLVKKEDVDGVTVYTLTEAGKDAADLVIQFAKLEINSDTEEEEAVA